MLGTRRPDTSLPLLLPKISEANRGSTSCKASQGICNLPGPSLSAERTPQSPALVPHVTAQDRRVPELRHKGVFWSFRFCTLGLKSRGCSRQLSRLGCSPGGSAACAATKRIASKWFKGFKVLVRVLCSLILFFVVLRSPLG